MKRFRYRSPGIHAIAVRVHRLDTAHVIPNTAAYDGCVSWVELEKDLSTDDATPVLDDGTFRDRLERFESALAGAAP